MGSFERWNTHLETLVEQEVMGIIISLAQDPSSMNLGTSVWDASIVLAKYLELNARKGDFARSKVRGKRALELGAGMGLGGMAFALLGADVTLSDYGDVMPLLERNVERNLSPAALRLNAGDGGWAAEAGRAEVLPLDWSDEASYQAFQPPYDYLLAADCVYSETAVPHLLRAVLRMAGPRTTVVICNEFRSHTVHDLFMASFGEHFSIKKVPHTKMDSRFRHPLINIYLLKKRRPPAAAEAAGGAAPGELSPREGGDGNEEEEAEPAAAADGADEAACRSNAGQAEAEGDGGMHAALGGLQLREGGPGSQAEPAGAGAEPGFAARRQGVALAQALRHVRVPEQQQPRPPDL